jgi:hypothetical protein
MGYCYGNPADQPEIRSIAHFLSLEFFFKPYFSAMKWACCFILLPLLFGCKEEQKTSQPFNKDTNQVSLPLKKGPANPYSAVDISPMDIVYFPLDYPLAKSSNPDTALPNARVIYSRPQKQGRQIFGSLIKWGEAWRLGANEATEIELFTNATIQGKRVNAGRYILYCIPQEKEWTIVFNNNLFSWGLHPYQSKDVIRFKVPVQKTPVVIEHFTMAFQKTTTGADLIMAWDDTQARLPFEF